MAAHANPMCELTSGWATFTGESWGNKQRYPDTWNRTTAAAADTWLQRFHR